VHAEPTATADAAPTADADTAARRRLAGVALLVAFAAGTLLEAASMGVSAVWRVAGAAFLGLAAAGFCYAAVVRPLLLTISTERRQAAARRRRDAVTVAHHVLIERATDALAVATNEGEALSAAAAATRELLPDREVRLLLCTATDATVAWRATVDSGGVAAPVPFTGDGRCVAASRRHPVSVAFSSAFDACPHLVADAAEWPPGHAVASACIPVSTGDTTIAVLHVVGPVGHPPDDEALAVLAQLAARTGTRVADLMPARETREPVHLDPLTGLPNHRAAVTAMKELIGGLTPFSLAVCDVDGLSDYNDRHGTSSGDRALQLFAQALRTTLRPGDVVVRWGGDEFLAVFPRCSSPNAQAAMERVREAMVLAMAESQMSPFTCSTGVADSNQGSSIDELVETADLALSVAKLEGGNRVRTAVY
jgi:diguanylate cyclase (GGDEF)-like protein